MNKDTGPELQKKGIRGTRFKKKNPAMSSLFFAGTKLKSLRVRRTLKNLLSYMYGYHV